MWWVSRRFRVVVEVTFFKGVCFKFFELRLVVSLLKIKERVVEGLGFGVGLFVLFFRVLMR